MFFSEKVRLSLAKIGACELICKFVEKYGSYCNDEDKRSVLQFACNIIFKYCSRGECEKKLGNSNLALTNVLFFYLDDSIKLLYDDDKGIVYHKLVEWLENAEPLVQYTAVIAVNNFACNDEHCKRMVEQSLHQKVLRVLKKCNHAFDSVKLQCGLLGILHRLAIHVDNKPILLADGLFEILYTMLDNPNLLVIPYLLGTFRIAIGGQSKCLRTPLKNQATIYIYIYLLQIYKNDIMISVTFLSFQKNQQSLWLKKKDSSNNLLSGATLTVPEFRLKQVD